MIEGGSSCHIDAVGRRKKRDKQRRPKARAAGGAATKTRTRTEPVSPPEARPITLRRFGRYSTLFSLGEGGFGVVHAAVDPRRAELVALKELRDYRAASSMDRSRFAAEVRLLKDVRHEGLCRLFDCELDAQNPFLVTELIAGATVAELVERIDKLDREELQQHADLPSLCLWIVARAADALHAVHELRRDEKLIGVVHRDVKPSNLMITFDGHVKVLDFGVALQPDRTRWTATEDVVGTNGYRAPEQERGLSVDRRADVWALGKVLSVLLVARTDFVDRRGDTLAPGLVDCVRRCSAEAPEERPPTAAELAASLDGELRAGFGAGDAAMLIEALFPEKREEFEKKCRIERRRWLLRSLRGRFVGLVVLVLAVGLLGIGGALVQRTLAPGTGLLRKPAPSDGAVSLTVADESRDPTRPLHPMLARMEPAWSAAIEWDAAQAGMMLPNGTILGAIHRLSEDRVAVFPRRPSDAGWVLESAKISLFDLARPPPRVRPSDWSLGRVHSRADGDYSLRFYSPLSPEQASMIEIFSVVPHPSARRPALVDIVWIIGHRVGTDDPDGISLLACGNADAPPLSSLIVVPRGHTWDDPEIVQLERLREAVSPCRRYYQHVDVERLTRYEQALSHIEEDYARAAR